MTIADYAVIDAANKVNMIGGLIIAAGYNAGTGLTLPFALFVTVAVPPELYNEACAVEIVLEDSAGNLVTLPPPAPGMEPQPMRIGQAITFEEPRFPQTVNAPRRYLPARSQWVMSFPTGLPLTPGEGYAWRVKIDDESRDDWTEKFVVLGQAPGPVIG